MGLLLVMFRAANWDTFINHREMTTALRGGFAAVAPETVANHYIDGGFVFKMELMPQNAPFKVRALLRPGTVTHGAAEASSC